MLFKNTITKNNFVFVVDLRTKIINTVNYIACIGPVSIINNKILLGENI